MNFVDALADVRDALVSGETPETAIRDAAADHGIPLVAMRNRAEKAYGDLATYAERTRATREVSPETARRLALGSVKDRIARLGSVKVGSREEETLHALVAEANRLGGDLVVHSTGTRRPSTPVDIDRLMMRLARLMMAA